MNLTPERLCAWFYAVAAQIAPEEFGFPPDAERNWLASLTRTKGRERSDLISGMKQGVNDLLTMSKFLGPHERKKLDLVLTARSLPSLGLMQAKLKRKHERVLKRGAIKNEEEYYIVAEILAGCEIDVSEAERAELGRIHAEYEVNSRITKPGLDQP